MLKSKTLKITCMTKSGKLLEAEIKVQTQATTPWTRPVQEHTESKVVDIVGFLSS